MSAAGSGVLYPNMRQLTEAEWVVVSENLGLIGFTIERFGVGYLSHLYTREDAWQSGYMGLCKAVTKFDPAKAKFSTYAVLWIRQALQRGQALSRGGVINSDEPPLFVSLDGDWSGDAHSLADTVQATDDTEREAEMRLLLTQLADLCGHEVDAAMLGRTWTERAVSDIAAEYGITAQAVRQRWRRVQRHMRSLLRKSDLAA